MILNTNDTIFLCAGVVFFSGAFIWFGVALYLAYTQIDEMLEHLKNCTAIVRRAPLRYGGPVGKILLIGGISGILTFPGFYLKHGGVSTTDLDNFPGPIKMKLMIMQWTLIGLITLMLLIFIFGKFTGIIE